RRLFVDAERIAGGDRGRIVLEDVPELVGSRGAWRLERVFGALVDHEVRRGAPDLRVDGIEADPVARGGLSRQRRTVDLDRRSGGHIAGTREELDDGRGGEDRRSGRRG